MADGVNSSPSKRSKSPSELPKSKKQKKAEQELRAYEKLIETCSDKLSATKAALMKEIEARIEVEKEKHAQMVLLSMKVQKANDEKNLAETKQSNCKWLLAVRQIIELYEHEFEKFEINLKYGTSIPAPASTTANPAANTAKPAQTQVASTQTQIQQSPPGIFNVTTDVLSLTNTMTTSTLAPASTATHLAIDTAKPAQTQVASLSTQISTPCGNAASTTTFTPPTRKFKKDLTKIQTILDFYEMEEELRRQKWDYYLRNPPSKLVQDLADDVTKQNITIDFFCEGIARAFKLISAELYKRSWKGQNKPIKTHLDVMTKTNVAIDILLLKIDLTQQLFTY